MTECVKGKVKGLQAGSYICAYEHDCKVEVDDKFFSLLKKAVKEQKGMMDILKDSYI